MKSSRSELYTRAVAEYIARHAEDRITEQMNETLETVGAIEDTFVTTASDRVLAQLEW